MTTTQSAEARVLGVAPAFPLRTAPSGYLQMAAGAELVRQAVIQLILTDPAERPYRVRQGVAYGTRLRRCVFEARDAAASIAQQEVARCLAVWEPRVRLQGVVVQTPDAATLVLRINYVLVQTGTADSAIVDLTAQAGGL